MKTLIILSLLVTLSSCVTSQGTAPSPQLIAVLPYIQSYKVPHESIKCTRHSDAEIDRMLNRWFVMATKLDFIVDGRHAKEGALIFSTQGSSGSIAVVVAVFRKNTGEIVIEDQRKCMLSDINAATAYRKKVIQFLTNK